MQNINEIMKEFGVEIAADKQAEFIKKVAENYLTRAEHEKKLGKLETDRDGWKEKAEAAEETLAKFEGVDLETMQRELGDWKQKAENAERDYQQKIEQREFEDALKAEFDGMKFTSESAKKAVIASIKDSGLKVKDGKILGLSDLVGQLKETDPNAFVDETQAALEQNKARFTQPVNKANLGNPGSMTKQDIMSIKDTTERQSAIAQNLHLFEGQ